MIKRYRFFGPFLDAQERWLNRMAEKGLQLINVKGSVYSFAPCEDAERYRYRVEFVGGLPFKALLQYKAFLGNAGYQTFFQDLNLSFPLGKLRRRPEGEASGKNEAPPEAFGKELLLLEKEEDGMDFQAFSNSQAQIAYVRKLRSMHACSLLAYLLAAALLAWRFYRGIGPSYAPVILAAVSLVMCLPVAAYHILLRRLLKEAGRQAED